MKKTFIALGSLLVLAAIAEGLILARILIDPRRLAAFLAALALILGVFAALTQSSFVRALRHWALQSAWAAAALPLLLLVPYLILALGTGTFSLRGLGKLVAYIAAPTLLLLPDRLGRPSHVGWRDLAAMLALALPVSAGWLGGIWTWPEDLYFFRPLFCVCVGTYAFLVVRNLDGVGYRLTFRKGDVVEGLANFAGFGLIGIPLGLAIGFIHFRPQGVSPWDFVFEFLGIYLTIAIPEEFLFRGVLQNFLVRSFSGPRSGLYGLLIASVIFGASHLHHPPVPNWKYGVLATIAGIFYGNAYRTRRRLSACALTHTLVDTVWRFWF